MKKSSRGRHIAALRNRARRPDPKRRSRQNDERKAVEASRQGN